MSIIYRVYQLVDPFTHLPYYIGFAKNPKRPYSHYKEYTAWINNRKVSKNPNYWKLSKIRDIIDVGGTYTTQIVFETEDIDQAYSKEEDLILYYGRLDLGTGILTNMSDGGRGFINPSQELRERLRSHMKRPLIERLGSLEKVIQYQQAQSDWRNSPEGKKTLQEAGLKGAQHAIATGWSKEAIDKRVATRKSKGSYSNDMKECNTPDAIWQRNKTKLTKLILKIMTKYQQQITPGLIAQARKEKFTSIFFTSVTKYFTTQELDDLFLISQQ